MFCSRGKVGTENATNQVCKFFIKISDETIAHQSSCSMKASTFTPNVALQKTVPILIILRELILDKINFINI